MRCSLPRDPEGVGSDVDPTRWFGVRSSLLAWSCAAMPPPLPRRLLRPKSLCRRPARVFPAAQPHLDFPYAARRPPKPLRRRSPNRLPVADTGHLVGTGMLAPTLHDLWFARGPRPFRPQVPPVPRRRAPPSSAPSASSPSKPASTYTSSPSKSRIPSVPSRSAPP